MLDWFITCFKFECTFLTDTWVFTFVIVLLAFHISHFSKALFLVILFIHFYIFHQSPSPSVFKRIFWECLRKLLYKVLQLAQRQSILFYSIFRFSMFLYILCLYLHWIIDFHCCIVGMILVFMTVVFFSWLHQFLSKSIHGNLKLVPRA